MQKNKNNKLQQSKKPPSFAEAVYAILVADVTLSFDNVLGVAAAAKMKLGY